MSSAPLLLTDDDALRAEVSRLAAAAGVSTSIAREGAVALQSWTSAPVVLIGADRVADLARMRPPRRDRVHVVGHGPIADDLFRDALAVGAESVAELPGSQTWLVELLTDAGDGDARSGVIIGVIGGCGGAGATMFAAALAAAASELGPALLMDTDALGAGSDRVLGLEASEGIRWDALFHATGRLSARSLREALPRSGALRVLTWPIERSMELQPFAVREALSAGSRGFHAVVLDLPRSTDSLTDELMTRCDHLILVSTLTVPGVAAATRVVRRFPAGTSWHLVTRGKSTGVLPEDLARLLGLPLLCSMTDQRGLDEAVDLGAGPLRSPRGPLARAARTTAHSLVDGGAQRRATVA